jgi:hypothetical protein
MPDLRRNHCWLCKYRSIYGRSIVRQTVNQGHNIDLIYAHWVLLRVALTASDYSVPYILQNHSSDLAVFPKLGRFGGTVLARRILITRSVFLREC